LISAARSLKKVNGAGISKFPTDSCKFPTEEIMATQNLNFAPKWGFSAQNVAFLDKFLKKNIFPQFSDSHA